MRVVALTAGVLVWTLVLAACGSSGSKNGEPSGDPANVDRDQIPSVAATWETDWARRSIDLSELVVGLPGRIDSRDGIPPIDKPTFEAVAAASQWLEDREPIVLLEIAGAARAYPLRILTQHEIVNDQLSNVPVAITYCPLCNSAVAFDRRVNGKTLRFGVSGLLRHSDLVMWDDASVSLWQQITGEALVGELTGTQLKLIAAPIVRWSQFRDSFPEGEVLSRDTGFGHSYGANPYDGYDSSSRPFLFNGKLDDRYPAMERVVGVTVKRAAKAYPFSVLGDERVVNDEVGGEAIVVFWGAADTASALDHSEVAGGRGVGVGVAYFRRLADRTLTFQLYAGDEVRDEETGSTWNLLGQAVAGPLAGETLTPVVHTNHLWFAWAAFNPDAPVYEGTPRPSSR